MFNSPSKDFGGWKEVVQPSFFEKTRGDTGFRDVVCKYEHRDLLGTVRAKTLELRTDSTGLLYQVQVPISCENVFELVARGDLAGSSFAFCVRQGGDEWRHENGIAVRHLISGQLLDVSVVSSPAYDAATVSLRAFAAKSFARQFDAPYDEVLHDFQTGEQARYFVRTDNRGPAPALVEARAEPTTEDHYLRKRLVEEVGRRIGADGMDWHRAKLELWRKKMAMDEGRPFSPEARSYVTQALMCRRDRWGNAFD